VHLLIATRQDLYKFIFQQDSSRGARPTFTLTFRNSKHSRDF